MSKWLDHLKPEDWNTAAYKTFCLNINDSFSFYATFSNTFASNMQLSYLMKMMLEPDFSSLIPLRVGKKEMHATMVELFRYNKWVKWTIGCIKNNLTISDAAFQEVLVAKYGTYPESKIADFRERREAKMTKRRKSDIFLENLCLLLELFYLSVNRAMNSIRPLNIVPLHSRIFKMYRSIKKKVIGFEQEIIKLIQYRNKYGEEITEKTYKEALLKFYHAILSATESYIDELFEARPALRPVLEPLDKKANPKITGRSDSELAGISKRIVETAELARIKTLEMEEPVTSNMIRQSYLISLLSSVEVYFQDVIQELYTLQIITDKDLNVNTPIEEIPKINFWTNKNILDRAGFTLCRLSEFSELYKRRNDILHRKNRVPITQTEMEEGSLHLKELVADFEKQAYTKRERLKI